MPQVIVLPHPELCPDGAVIEVEPGASLCEAALAHGIEIEHACEQACACTTCHVYVREGYESLAPPGDDEDDRLDQAWGLELDSRLSCQVRVGETDLVIELPRYTVNRVSESRSGS
jgi:2Fe-2S ferredoxin